MPNNFPEQVVSSFEFTIASQSKLECINDNDSQSVITLDANGFGFSQEISANGVALIDLSGEGFVDNAVVNAEIVSTETPRSFLCWLVTGQVGVANSPSVTLLNFI